MPWVCYQQYVQSSQNKEAILQMLHYFHRVYFVTDCLYQCLLPFIQWCLNNNFTLLKFCSFNTLNIFRHKVHRKLDMFFISTKKSAHPENLRNQHCQFKDSTEQFWANPHTRTSVLLKLMVCSVTSTLSHPCIIRCVMKKFIHLYIFNYEGRYKLNLVRQHLFSSYASC